MSKKAVVQLMAISAVFGAQWLNPIHRVGK